MSGRTRLYSLLLVAYLTCSPSSAVAQLREMWDKMTNPTITVDIEHPPATGLEVKTVAFPPGEGDCVDEFLDSLVQDFVQNGVEVVDRQRLQLILDEHKLNVSGLIDEATAAEIGQLSGAQALVFVRMQRCAIERTNESYQVEDSEGRVSRRYKLATRAFVTAAVQVVDLTSGRIVSARSVDGRGEAVNNSDACCSNYPSEHDVRQAAFQHALQATHRMFFPWIDRRELYFYDDKDCNLRFAYRLLQGGDKAGALSQSLANVRSCESSGQPRVLGRAYYNLGMMQFILGHYDDASASFKESLRLGGGEIVTQAMADCRTAREAALGLGADDAQFSQQPALSGITGVPDAQPASEDSSIEGRLMTLKALYDKGLIGKPEYERRRQEILDEI